MPTYEFLNTETGEEFERLMSISAREEYLKENPNITPIISAPSIVSVYLLAIQKKVKFLMDLRKFYLRLQRHIQQAQLVTDMVKNPSKMLRLERLSKNM